MFAGEPELKPCINQVSFARGIVPSHTSSALASHIQMTCVTPKFTSHTEAVSQTLSGVMSSHASQQVPTWNAMDWFIPYAASIFQVAGISTQLPGVQASHKKSLVKYLRLLVVSPCAWHTFLLWIFQIVASQHPLPKQKRNRGKFPLAICETNSP